MVKLHTKSHLKCLIAKGYILRCYDANLIERSELSTDDKTEGVVVETPMRRLEDRDELPYMFRCFFCSRFSVQGS